MALHPAFSEVDHRPWPVPDRRWAWRQKWHDLLFAHWPVPVSALRPLIPSALEVEERDGTAWIAAVPFRMSGVMRRPLPDVPGVSAFPELNVRTYVTDGERPGVWFFSLDATQPHAVWFARRFFHLPYHRARMDLQEARPGAIRYRSERIAVPAVTFEAVYEATSAPVPADPGTIEHWFTERYCLYAQSPRGRLFRTEVHHPRWQLQTAAVAIERNDLLAVHGFELDPAPTYAHFARDQDVVVWSPERVGHPH